VKEFVAACKTDFENFHELLTGMGTLMNQARLRKMTDLQYSKRE